MRYRYWPEDWVHGENPDVERELGAGENVPAVAAVLGQLAELRRAVAGNPALEGPKPSGQIHLNREARPAASEELVVSANRSQPNICRAK